MRPTPRRTVALVAVCAAGAVAIVPMLAGAASGKAAQGIENTQKPVVSGTPRAGETLETTRGTWTYNGQPLTRGTYEYAWRRCDSVGEKCKIIAEAQTAKYILGNDDVGHTIRSAVTASFNNQSSTAASRPTAVVTTSATKPVNVANPTISGTAKQGQTLTAAPGTWSGTPPLTYSFQWIRCDQNASNCGDVAGATGDTLALGTDDLNRRLKVRVTATNSRGSGKAVSAPTDVVVPASPGGGVISVNDVPPCKTPSCVLLVMDDIKFEPTVLTTRNPFTLRVRVVTTTGFRVQGALVFPQPVPYGLIYPVNTGIGDGHEVRTDSSGIATITLRPTSALPVGKTGALQIFLRARRESDPLLSGISTRRLVQISIR